MVPSQRLTANRIIELLNLRPLPEEGGFYAETHRAAVIVAPALPARYLGSRPLHTAIYYLLTAVTFSALLRLPTDEIFHHYLGDPVEQLRLVPDGTGTTILIGPDLVSGQRPQVLVPRDVWQGARLLPGGTHGFALMGTTMAPGFDFADYQPGRRAELVAAHPTFAALIAALTR